MRRSAATAGVLLALLGIFLMNQGSQIIVPLAESLGLTSHLRTENALIAPTLLTVPPMNSTYISTHLTSAGQVSGSFHVGTGREVDFYVMNEKSYHDWRAGRPATILVSVLSTSLYNFTVKLDSEQSYYFVFENQDSTRRTVVFTLYTVGDAIVIHPAVQNLPYGLTAIGVLLFIWGITTGKKKPQRVEATHAEEAAVAGWRCRFCRAENPLGETFCQNCRRSRQ